MADYQTPAQQQYPDLNPYASSNGNSTMNGVKNSESPPAPSSTMASLPNSLQTAAQNTMDSIKNNGTVQTLANGPVADKARTEANATRNEFGNLAASRTTPGHTTANGQNLTHYHSFFYNLLSWENPRATGIAYLAITIFIIATRYVPIVRYLLKGTYMILGITAAAEIAGRTVMGEGFATKMRPKRYYTIPHETLESMMVDLVELGNFFVIEFQRIVFAENVGVTIGAFTAALLTYFLIKITPPWGMALLFTTFAFFTPLIYIQNQALIDGQLANASDLLNKQTAQVRELASHHGNKAMEASQSAFKDYSAKASEMMGGAKQAAVDKGVVSHETAAQMPGAEIKKEDFPTAPKVEPAVQHDGVAEKEPLLS